MLSRCASPASTLGFVRRRRVRVERKGVVMSYSDSIEGVRRRRWGQGGGLAALLLVAIAAACSTESGTPGAGGAGATGASASPSPAASSGYLTLARSAHPLARPENDLGRLEPTKVLHNLSLVFKLSNAQRAERDTLLSEVQRPGSPSYHHWLTPADYA